LHLYPSTSHRSAARSVVPTFLLPGAPSSPVLSHRAGHPRDLPSFPTRRSSDLNHTSRGSISTSTLPSIKLRKCSSKIIKSILSFISGRLATKSNQIKQLIRNGRSASLQRTFKKSFTSFSHSTRNKTRD